MKPRSMSARRDPKTSVVRLPAALLIGAVRLYRVTLSGWLAGHCRFYPSCSAYAEEALRVHGALRGSAMAIWRVLRCNPFGAGGLDPVSRPIGRDIRHDLAYEFAYEHVIRNALKTGRETPARSSGPLS